MVRGVKVLAGLAVCVLLAISVSASAESSRLEFETLDEEKRYQKLVRELRCTVCQSESIYESNAAFAKDVRVKVYEMLQEGKNEAEIVGFMKDRYGDYISFRPALQKNTWVLWFAPLLMLLLGMGIWRSVVGRRRQQTEAQISLSSEDQAELARRLK